MSNLIPPLLSSSPPPIVGPLDEDDDDEFGDFRAAADSYNCDDFSLPPSPQKSPEKELKTDFSRVNLDINSNKSQKVTSTSEMSSQDINGSVLNEEVDKDFQDRRKSSDNGDEPNSCEFQVNCSNSQLVSSINHKENPTSDHSSQIQDEQYVDKKVCDSISEVTSSQSTKIQNLESNNTEDDFSEIQSAEPDSITCEDISTVEAVANKIDSGGHSNLNSLSNEECMFDAFSESVQENTDNSDGLSQINESSEIKSEEDVTNENNEISNKDNENDDFENSSKEINDELSESSMSLRVCETDPKLSDDEFGDFANFGNEIDKPADEGSEDEFDDFVDPLPPQTQSVQEQTEDDFGDFESSAFADFSSQSCEKPTFLEVDEKNAAEKSETILKEVFPTIDLEVDEFEFEDQTKGDKIFDELKDVTETNALIYQWSKSSSQKMFFKALNIDTRNILYGPAWNCSMPRFAANLGLTPLEPVKTEILTPTPVQNVSSPSNSSQKSNGDIPTAQFDWSGSGLINPLDYLEQLVASLDIPSTTNPSNQSPSPSNELLDEWDLWLQSTSAELPGNVPEDSSPAQIPTDFLPTTSDKPESLPSLFDVEMLEKLSAHPTPDSENIELPKPTSGQEDFSPFESPKLIPLRETHISSELNDFNGKPGWLQPTIVTPDLPRKETAIDPEDDDEFDDFQMVLPEDKEKKSDVKTLDLSEFGMTSRVPAAEKTSHNHEHIFGVTLNSGPKASSVQSQPSDVNDDDEFTEFHSSIPVETFKPAMPQTEIIKPVVQSEIFKPLQPVPLEPLKPVVQYSTHVTQINWPNPGVTDEDIKNIELSYSRKDEKTKNDKPEEAGKENSKSSLEDDEWSDFVSVTNPVKSVLPERTATPDLPLSVLNLNSVQAPKQPIPVITPSGLVQTKLSSNITKSVVQTTVQPNMFRPPTTQFQPSIISSQFAANFPGNSGSAPSMKSQDDDDDWSDFVSSQPPPQVNGYQQNSVFNQARTPQMNWSAATTNIIMNPTHFETFPAYAPPPGRKTSPMAARNPISSISAIPDLDFIAPKNRTSKK